MTGPATLSDALAVIADQAKTIAELQQAVVNERTACAFLAYRIAAETRHVTLGDAIEKAIIGRGAQ